MEDLATLASELSREKFEASPVYQFAVYHLLTVIGEATGNVSERTRDEFADVPWRQMKGMRNILVHRYHRIDRTKVWLTVTKDTPPLEPLFRAIVDTLDLRLKKVRDRGHGL
ncbi:MAG: DUF86 domain-containing protein [Acidobacteria bacterium]|nr:DUF86 domain-containing protein [Acidobacteriota bacterium]